jgi:hypothetical protein
MILKNRNDANKNNIPKNEAKEYLPKIKYLTSYFILSELDLDFSLPKNSRLSYNNIAFEISFTFKPISDKDIHEDTED